MKRIVVGMVCVAWLAGCTSVMQGTVRKRAAFDFACAEEKLEVVKLGDRTFGVTGCEKRGTYLITGGCDGISNCVAVLNSRTAPGKE